MQSLVVAAQRKGLHIGCSGQCDTGQQLQGLLPALLHRGDWSRYSRAYNVRHAITLSPGKRTIPVLTHLYWHACGSRRVPAAVSAGQQMFINNTFQYTIGDFPLSKQLYDAAFRCSPSPPRPMHAVLQDVP